MMSGKMKNSGIEWIGEIPEDWEVIRLKYSIKNIADKISLKTYNNQELLMYIGLEHVEQQTGRLIENYQPIYDFNGDTISFQKGDVLFGKLRPYLVKCLLADCNGKCSSEFFVLRSEHNILPTYLRLIMLSKGFIEYVDSSTFGVKMPRAEWGFVKNVFIPLPSLPTQQCIADYLDQKCAEINRIIAAKQKQNELLREYKQSIIYEAVTKGLDKNVKYKDSGIEWIGDIPEDWEVIRLKYLCKIIKTGTTPSTQATQYFDGSLNWFTPADFSEGFELSDASRKLDYIAVEDSEVPLFSAGAIMIVGIGATMGKIGYLIDEGSCNQQITGMVIKNKYDSKGIMYYLYATSDCIRNMANYTTLPILNNQILSNVMCVTPSKKEHSQIVCYLDQKCGEIDRIIKSNDDMITKLKEYRQSVIYEAVTGKIEM